jgi:hypothetical protein
MANCHDSFLQFNSKIRLSEPNRQMLRSSRDLIRGRIDANFRKIADPSKYGQSVEFHSQGSYVMDTIITPIDEDFDLDDGVYFMGQLSRLQRPSTEQFHELVLQLLKPIEDTIAKVIDKPTCIRVQTDRGFHIDLPIYYAGDKNCPDLAHTVDGWMLSNPLEFIEWFEEKTKSGFQKGFLLESRMFAAYNTWKEDIRNKDVQLRRLVRYLKAWANLRKGEMPSGIIMTILAANNFVLDNRDDISFTATLENIRKTLEKDFVCRRPTTPKGDDLFAAYTNSQKEYFMTALRTFASAARQALDNPNPKEGCIKWQRHLGDRFPCQHMKDEIPGSNTYRTPAILGGAAESA